jgi:ATP synthase protein I
MVDPESDPRPDGAEERFRREVGRKQSRKIRSRREGERSAWFGLGMFGLVGWSVAIPTLIGIALGAWLDRLQPGPPSWTLTMLLLGIIAGCINAWYWINRESGRDQSGSDNEEGRQ